jgi:hypothetical protein
MGAENIACCEGPPLAAGNVRAIFREWQSYSWGLLTPFFKIHSDLNWSGVFSEVSIGYRWSGSCSRVLPTLGGAERPRPCKPVAPGTHERKEENNKKRKKRRPLMHLINLKMQ